MDLRCSTASLKIIIKQTSNLSSKHKQPVVVKDSFNNINKSRLDRIESESCELELNRFLKFGSIPSPSLGHKAGGDSVIAVV